MKNRYEQEIEQLLSELEAESDGKGAIGPAPADRPPPLDDQPSPFAPKPKPGLQLISPAKLALAGIVLALLGLLLPVLSYLAIAGLVIMVAAIAWMLVRRIAAPPAAAYWRGRPVETEPQGKWQRFRRWLAR